MRKSDKAILLSLLISIVFIYIGIWVAEIPLSNKFIGTGATSIFICLLFIVGGKDES